MPVPGDVPVPGVPEPVPGVPEPVPGELPVLPEPGVPLPEPLLSWLLPGEPLPIEPSPEPIVLESVSLEPVLPVPFALLGSFAGRSLPHAATAKLNTDIIAAACSRIIFTSPERAQTLGRVRTIGAVGMPSALVNFRTLADPQLALRSE